MSESSWTRKEGEAETMLPFYNTLIAMDCNANDKNGIRYQWTVCFRKTIIDCLIFSLEFTAAIACQFDVDDFFFKARQLHLRRLTILTNSDWWFFIDFLDRSVDISPLIAFFSHFPFIKEDEKYSSLLWAIEWKDCIVEITVVRVKVIMINRFVSSLKVETDRRLGIIQKFNMQLKSITNDKQKKDFKNHC